MIRATFFFNDDFKIKGFELKGHADHAEIGYDIVCSAATSNSVAVINSLECLVKARFEKVQAREGLISCFVEDESLEASQMLLQHLRLALDGISNEYPKNIKIFEK